MRTDSPPPHTRGAEHVIDAVQARDDGVRLARRAQRWIAGLAVGMASGLAALDRPRVPRPCGAADAHQRPAGPAPG